MPQRFRGREAAAVVVVPPPHQPAGQIPAGAIVPVQNAEVESPRLGHTAAIPAQHTKGLGLSRWSGLTICGRLKKKQIIVMRSGLINKHLFIYLLLTLRDPPAICGLIRCGRV